jgi:hypothetical protein
MTESMSVADRYLREVRGSLPLAPRAETDQWREGLAAYLNGVWPKLLRDLAECERSDAGAGKLAGLQIGVLLVAVGLFALGRIEVAGHVVRHAEKVKTNARQLASVLRALLPLPPEIPRGRLDAIGAWIEAHALQLAWNPRDQRYEVVP